MVEMVIRRGGPADVEPSLAVWRAAEQARRSAPASSGHGGRVRGHLENPAAFHFVAEDGSGVVGMAAGMQGLADDGAGAPVVNLCHVGAVFVAPEHWGEGLGGRLVDAVLLEARSRGYNHAQLWAHADNGRAQGLYERRGFARSGREKNDDAGETIVHYEVRLRAARETGGNPIARRRG